MKKICLVCNAHLDLVWQWEWEEGLAEALSTFRIAADFCEEFEGFVFNHNESILYQWVEEYEPALFARIQRLVAQGRWHIMGGWYLQPDCNMPSGESMVRQIATGRKYFRDKFGKIPTTAINFDSFGHSRGLVQILKHSGYDSYVVGRPDVQAVDVPGQEFNWVGYDGSEIAVHLSYGLYNSFLGKATEKIGLVLQYNPDKDPLMVLWGVGNHGGGPSHRDLEMIGELKKELEKEGTEIVHTTPEEYFSLLKRENLPRFSGSLDNSMVGCYTSQVRIKQAHRKLESLLFSTEKLVCAAELQVGFEGKWDRIHEAEQALLFSQFHDVLPGTTVQRAEEASLRTLHYGQELLSRERMRAFMAFAAHEKLQLQEGDIPILVYNTQPYPVSRVVECEFQLQDQNRSGTYTDFDVYVDGMQVPAQLEKEDSTIPIDWRKKLLFRAELKPFEITTAICRPRILPKKPEFCQPAGEEIVLQGGEVTLTVSKKTGRIGALCRKGSPVLLNDAAKLLVIRGSEDPWGMTVSAYRNAVGVFTLADAETAGKVAGLKHPLEPVRIIEQGALRTVVEAIFTYDRSAAVMHYVLDHTTGQVELELRLLWMQPDQMVKLSFKPAFSHAVCWAQELFGRKITAPTGDEKVNQQWLMLQGQEHALGIINTGMYAHDFYDNELRLTVLHSPGYCCHPVDDLVVLPQDRFLPRVDTGERCFKLVLLCGHAQKLMTRIDTAAQEENEMPFALSFFPAGDDKAIQAGMSLDNRSILLSAMTKRETGYLLRLYNPTDTVQHTVLTVPAAGIRETLEFSPFEIKPLLLQEGTVREVLLDGSEMR